MTWIRLISIVVLFLFSGPFLLAGPFLGAIDGVMLAESQAESQSESESESDFLTAHAHTNSLGWSGRSAPSASGDIHPILPYSIFQPPERS